MRACASSCRSADKAIVCMCAQLLTTPLPEVLEKDGSIEAFQRLLSDIANPTSLASFDPEIFKAALTGMTPLHFFPLQNISVILKRMCAFSTYRPLPHA